MRLPSVPRLILYALLLVLCGALVVAASTSGTAFGAYNPAWDGTSEMRTLADTHSDSTLTLNTQPYRSTDSGESLAVILAPSEPYSSAELSTIREFVRTGGTLLVADNFGPSVNSPPYGNTVLAAVGATSRFDGGLLRDEQNYYRSPALPVASNVSTHPYTDDVSALTLNYGTAVEPGRATSLVSTSSVAYLDRNQSGSLDETETVGRYTVAAVEPVGNGSVVAVGDPSIFINSMITQEGNMAFARALFTSHERVIIDYSAGGSTPPLAAIVLFVQTTPAIQALLAAGGVVVAWLLTSRPATFARPVQRIQALLPAAVTQPHSDSEAARGDTASPTEAELLAYLKQQHPDWDEARLQRIVARINDETKADSTHE